MPRISSLPQAVSASLLDEFPIVQGNITKRVNFLTAQLSGLFLPLDGSISTAKLAPNAVSAAKLASDISNDSNRAVTVNHIQTAAVDESKLASDSVTTSKIKDLNVTGPKLAVGSLSISKFNTVDKQFLTFAGSSRPGTSVATTGGIENVVVWDGGSGYSTGSPPAVSFVPASPTGDNATAVAIVDPAGFVSSVTITYPGSGYESAPSVVIVSGTTQAKAVAYCCVRGISANDSNNCFGGGSWRAGYFITTDKKAKSVGLNEDQKLAKGSSNTNSWLPSECAFYSSVSTPNSFIKASKIYSAYNSAFMIDTNGKLYGVGRNDVGQLGDGTTTERHSFLQSPYAFNNSPIIRMDMHQGTYYPTVAALTASGQLWFWGYNNGGECGVGNANNVLIPSCPLPSVFVSDFSLGGNNYGTSYLIEAGSGKVYTCGMGNYGQRSQGLPAGNSNSFTTFKLSAGTDFTNAKKVVGIGGSGTYAYNTVAILTNVGTVFCAGYGANGQLGNGTTSNTSALTGYCNQVSGLTGVVDIAGSVAAYSGPSCFFAIMGNGDVRAWGNNGQGSWGIGAAAVNNNYGTPQTIWNAAVQGASAVKIIQGGDGYTNSSCYLLDSLGRLWSAGYNGNGQLGDGTTTNRPTWNVFRLNNAYKIIDFKIDGYDTTTMPRVLCEDGKVYTCGYNNAGQLASGDNYDRYTPSGMIF